MNASSTTPPSDRYHRQVILPQVGEAGQRRLARARAAIIGCGALGCASADLLARAGVGEIILVDRDIVELTNLQRQTLFTEADARAGLPKAEAAARRLGQVNSQIRLRPVIADVTFRNILEIVGPALTPGVEGGAAGVLVDGTDNFQTRYLINDVAVKYGVPYVYGGVVGGGGMVMPVVPGVSPCLRCVFDEPPAPGSTPTCDTAGVLGPAVMMVAAQQAAEVMKLLLGRLDLVGASLTEFDLWSNRRRGVDLARARRADCPCCGRGVFEFLDGLRVEETTVLCGRRAVQVWPEDRGGGTEGSRLDLAALAHRLAGHGPVASHEFMLNLKLREAGPGGSPIELTVFADGRGVVRGTDDVAVARAVYARYVGL